MREVFRTVLVAAWVLGLGTAGQAWAHPGVHVPFGDPLDSLLHPVTSIDHVLPLAALGFLAGRVALRFALGLGVLCLAGSVLSARFHGLHGAEIAAMTLASLAISIVSLGLSRLTRPRKVFEDRAAS
jgi:hydrogenase/urease accessory protein HupE